MPLLSHCLSQDPLEKYFGLQRQRGRVSDNPTVDQFFKNDQALRVASACAIYKHQGQLSRKQRHRQSPASET